MSDKNDLNDTNLHHINEIEEKYYEPWESEDIYN